MKHQNIEQRIEHKQINNEVYYKSYYFWAHACRLIEPKFKENWNNHPKWKNNIK